MKRTLPALLGLSLLLASCNQPSAPQTGGNNSLSPDLKSDTTRQAPAAVTLGQTYSGVIAGQDRDSDYYAFDAAAGDQLRVSVKASAGSTLDPYIRLYWVNKDGWKMLEKDDDNSYAPGNKAKDAQILFNADQAGRYVVEVTSFKLANDHKATDNDPRNQYTFTLSRR
ncbi:PPC domain-containing protein [Deinococcus sp. Marseille-Q6407]|uniref:PPC domain-containing protein n=1 Tax=Deinococcus sp. Marseille-Q6407 TaxID=2969223 RepID=UPI0021C0021C|nr:PPC domain-containing protein [Deinococcus sp. Marseille-Q6407]